MSHPTLSTPTTLDQNEIKQFNALAESWWDEQGPFRPLHELNPVRLQFIIDVLKHHFSLKPTEPNVLKGLTILDIGCGGGLVAEPLARLGATVTAIDAGENNIAIARAHAKEVNLTINYQIATVEDLIEQGNQYDVVTCLEVVEHVASLAEFITECSKVVKSGGVLILSTLNRTLKSFILGIVAAEYILRWVPRGTHQWSRFIQPAELIDELLKNGLHPLDMQGVIYHPLKREWQLSKRLGVNYMVAVDKPDVVGCQFPDFCFPAK